MSNKCVMVGQMLTPCDALNKIIDHNPIGKAKGLVFWEFTSTKTGKKTKSYAGARTKQFPDGIVFNHCPMCGEKIYKDIEELEVEFNTKQEG